MPDAKVKAPILCFTLSMPRNNSWDGKWSGEERLYAKIRRLDRSRKAMAKAARLIADAPFYYHFGDGWSAEIGIREVDLLESRKITHKSVGFCGYDWMIESIVMDGRIDPKHARI